MTAERLIELAGLAPGDHVAQAVTGTPVPGFLPLAGTVLDLRFTSRGIIRALVRWDDDAAWGAAGQLGMVNVGALVKTEVS